MICCLSDCYGSQFLQTCTQYALNIYSNRLFWFVGWCPYSGWGFKDQEILSPCVIQPSDQRVWSPHGGGLHSLLTRRVSTDGKGGKQTRYCFQHVHMYVVWKIDFNCDRLIHKITLSQFKELLIIIFTYCTCMLKLVVTKPYYLYAGVLLLTFSAER